MNLKGNVFGALLLMIAFVISAMIFGFVGPSLGLDTTVRMGFSLSFFLIVFIALVIYDNLRKKVKVG